MLKVGERGLFFASDIESWAAGLPGYPGRFLLSESVSIYKSDTMVRNDGYILKRLGSKEAICKWRRNPVALFSKTDSFFLTAGTEDTAGYSRGIQANLSRANIPYRQGTYFVVRNLPSKGQRVRHSIFPAYLFSRIEIE